MSKRKIIKQAIAKAAGHFQVEADEHGFSPEEAARYSATIKFIGVFVPDGSQLLEDVPTETEIQLAKQCGIYYRDVSLNYKDYLDKNDWPIRPTALPPIDHPCLFWSSNDVLLADPWKKRYAPFVKRGISIGFNRQKGICGFKWDKHDIQECTDLVWSTIVIGMMTGNFSTLAGGTLRGTEGLNLEEVNSCACTQNCICPKDQPQSRQRWILIIAARIADGYASEMIHRDQTGSQERHKDAQANADAGPPPERRDPLKWPQHLSLGNRAKRPLMAMIYEDTDDEDITDAVPTAIVMPPKDLLWELVPASKWADSTIMWTDEGELLNGGSKKAPIYSHPQPVYFGECVTSVDEGWAGIINSSKWPTTGIPRHGTAEECERIGRPYPQISPEARTPGGFPIPCPACRPTPLDSCIPTRTCVPSSCACKCHGSVPTGPQVDKDDPDPEPAHQEDKMLFSWEMPYGVPNMHGGANPHLEADGAPVTLSLEGHLPIPEQELALNNAW